jgi:hypothetical protein
MFESAPRTTQIPCPSSQFLKVRCALFNFFLCRCSKRCLKVLSARVSPSILFGQGRLRASGGCIGSSLLLISEKIRTSPFLGPGVSFKSSTVVSTNKQRTEWLKPLLNQQQSPRLRSRRTTRSDESAVSRRFPHTFTKC